MQKTILAVDDSVTMRQMVSFTLKSAGFDVIEAEDGKDALNKIGGKQVELVLTDLNMPMMDGIELIRQLRQRSEYRFTPILMLTTESQDGKKREGQQAGATGWIVKPFNPEQLLKVIARVLP